KMMIGRSHVNLPRIGRLAFARMGCQKRARAAKYLRKPAAPFRRKMAHNEDPCRKPCGQARHEAGQGLDTARGRSDDDDVMTRHSAPLGTQLHISVPLKFAQSLIPASRGA